MEHAKCVEQYGDQVVTVRVTNSELMSGVINAENPIINSGEVTQLLDGTWWDSFYQSLSPWA